MKNLKVKLLFFLRRPYMLIIYPVIRLLPQFRFLYDTTDYQGKVSFEFWFKQKVLNWGGNRRAYWPVHWTSHVYDVENILVGIDSAPGIMGGAYITGVGGITIGDYCLFAKNIVIVTANHNIYDYRQRDINAVRLGDYCWLGSGAKIMPGVILGDHTIVAAGAVVTKSFEEGYCILGGVPARKIKDLDRAACVKRDVRNKYHGYIRAEKFGSYRKKNLEV